MVSCAGVALGFDTRTNVVKKLPVAPSARNQSVAVRVAPADSCPPLNVGVPKYMARSAAPAKVKVATAPNERFTSSGISPA